MEIGDWRLVTFPNLQSPISQSTISLIDDDGHRAALQRLWDEGAPIGVKAVDGDEQAARLHRARVVGD